MPYRICDHAGIGATRSADEYKAFLVELRKLADDFVATEALCVAEESRLQADRDEAEAAAADNVPAANIEAIGSKSTGSPYKPPAKGRGKGKGSTPTRKTPPSRQGTKRQRSEGGEDKDEVEFDQLPATGAPQKKAEDGCHRFCVCAWQLPLWNESALVLADHLPR